MQSKTVVILGTGGTIAGTAANASDNLGYAAAQLGVAELMRRVTALSATPVEAEQIAQLDSKDMDHGVWLLLAQRCAHHLARPEVAGIVITHGTDTLEETAYFLHCVLGASKPVVLTAAMRPATSLQADGPQNLLDAVRVAQTQGARGVTAVLAGTVHGAREVRKIHPYRLDAFDSGDSGPLARVEEGALRLLRDWPQDEPVFSLALLPPNPAEWPQVHIVTSHAGASGAIVSALCAAGADGLVVAGTGNGSVHHALAAALQRAQDDGVLVLRSSRCNDGRVIAGAADALPSAGQLTPVKARIELMLRLLAAR
jgi:L-asparaginase